ncbi:MAG: amidohydrolase, partial [Thermovirga sp.]|nr:amidohydrolase [Thermovirga sp.]
MLDKIKKLAEGHKHQIAEWRHEFHANPELSFQEFETTKRIKKYLEQMGFTNVRVGTGGIETGVVADLDTQKDGPCIALRADIDALPMQEVGTPPYRSRNDGVMHACGHDSHIAMLLGAAYVLKTMESELPGKVRFIFQPSEESPHKSGARAMIQDGVLDGVDAISGLHIWSSLPAGVVGYKAGPFMASADEWEC